MQQQGEPKAGDREAMQLLLLPHSVPVLTSDEISVVEKPLGQGGYCTVLAVESIHMLQDDDDYDTDLSMSSSSSQSPSSSADSPVNIKKLPSLPSCHARRNFAQQFASYETSYNRKKIVVPGYTPPFDPMETVERPPKLALKRIKANLKPKRHRVAVNDLAAEVVVLAKCRHVNIISLYAVGRDICITDENDSANGSDDGNAEDDNERSKQSLPQISFALVDRLRSTLQDRIYKWKEDKGIGLIFSHRQWLERMVIAHKLADAIRYLHSRGIMHRDIHPGNIGFTDDNVVKLFDFGLVKSVPRSANGPLNGDENELFDLTGTTGTMRYMAPEIALNLPYNFKADVYSFSLVLHEILSLFKPFKNIKEKKLFDEKVILGGERPNLDISWPKGLRNLVGTMWESDVAKRLGSNEVCTVLGELLRGDDEKLYPKGWFKRMAIRRR